MTIKQRITLTEKMTKAYKRWQDVEDLYNDSNDDPSIALKRAHTRATKTFWHHLRNANPNIQDQDCITLLECLHDRYLKSIQQGAA
jgi:hypothetical protein